MLDVPFGFRSTALLRSRRPSMPEPGQEVIQGVSRDTTQTTDLHGLNLPRGNQGVHECAADAQSLSRLLDRQHDPMGCGVGHGSLLLIPLLPLVKAVRLDASRDGAV